MGRLGVLAGASCAALLAIVVVSNSARWLGAVFPGFFVLANRVVPSVSLPTWGEDASRLFQRQIVEVQGEAVRTAAEVYESVRRYPVGTPIRYTMRAADGTITTEEVRSRRFSSVDYLLIFGAYLLTGASFILAALFVVWQRPQGPATWALLSSGMGVGVFALTAIDLYDPYWFFRLHAFAEAAFPAGAVHLALVFPRPRFAGHRRPLLIGVYLSCLLLGLMYESVLYWPAAYTTVHLVATVAQGLSGVIILAAIIHDRLTADSALVRWRCGILGASAVTAFVAPTVLIGASGVLGGRIPVNGAALTAFIFPLSLAYAVLRRSLFESDILESIGSSRGSPRVRSSVDTRLPAWSKWLDSATGQRLGRGSALGGVILSGVLVIVVAFHSTRWIDATFPGFFVMTNRVVPSVSLPSWDDDVAGLFQHEVLTVSGEGVRDGADVYAQARAHAPGTVLQYTFRGPDGTRVTREVRSRRFSGAEYVSLFGSFLLTGSSFLFAGLLVFLLRPRSAMSGGFLSTAVIGGVFVITAADLYGPYWFFRLHVLAEAMVPAGLLHLACVFPTNRLRRFGPLVVGSYVACFLMAVPYELALYRPVAYSAMHLLATTVQGLGGLMLIWVITFDLLTTESEFVRRRVLVAGIGTLAAFLVPTALMAASGLRAGAVPVNAAAFTGFLFPLSFAYAIVRRDLFKVDVFLHQGAAVLVALTTSTWVALGTSLLVIKTRWHA